MAGLFLPETYVSKKPNDNDMNVASIAWGFSLGVLIFTGAKGLRQTYASWQRRRRMSAYIILLWLEWTSSSVMSAITWCHLRNYIKPGFPIFFTLIFLWSIQIQALMQIIINRIQILMVVRENARKLKIGVFLLLLCINISVFCIWIPARLQISETWIHINNIWDRIEKVVFLIIDASLNLYFIYLVRSRLIANGLSKYNRLFNFNLAIISVSIAMDILLIGMMSLPNDFVYVQFHPLAYLVKLHIELNMADLITKVVKASNPSGYPDYSNSRSNGKSTTRGAVQTGSKKMGSMFGGNNLTFVEAGGDDFELSAREPAHGIQKTIETQVVINKASQGGQEDDDFASESSSTRQLKKEHYHV